MQKKSFKTPDKTQTPPKTRLEIVRIANNTLVRTTFEPGWKWSVDIKPSTDTDSCQVHHLICMISGQLKAVMNDGTEMEFGPGDIADIPPGHDAWVVDGESVVGIDLGGNLQ